MDPPRIHPNTAHASRGARRGAHNCTVGDKLGLVGEVEGVAGVLRLLRGRRHGAHDGGARVPPKRGLQDARESRVAVRHVHTLGGLLPQTPDDLAQS